MASLRYSLCRAYHFVYKGAVHQSLRHKATIPVTSPGREEAVVMNNERDIFVCWHPEPVIPYECTMPIPDVAETDTMLNIQYNDEVKKLFQSPNRILARHKLEAITFTTKHPWFPSHKKDRIKNYRPMPREREYL